MRAIGILALLVVLQASMPGNAQAQPPGCVELGLDGGVAFLVFDSGTDVVVGFPAQNLRVGVFVVEALQIEPNLGFTIVSTDVEGDTVPAQSDTDYGLQFGVSFSYHGLGAESTLRPFVRVEAQLVALGEHGQSASQFGLGAGIGVKIRSRQHVGARLEIAVAKFFESDLRDRWEPALGIGFSYFTK
jgi:hypothetical protein